MKAKSQTKLFTEIIGWYGTCAIVLAYVLVSFKIIEADSVTYQLLNLTGAIGIIIISVAKSVKQSVILNAFWALIATIALFAILIK